MSSEILDASSCRLELTAANLCLQQTSPEECSCYESTATFVSEYPLSLQYTFVETQAFVPQTDPAFCETAVNRVCEDFVQNNSCCCGLEVEVYRKCLFDEVLVPSFPRIQAGNSDCRDTCDYLTFSNAAGVNSNAEDGGNSLFIIIGAAVGGVLALILLVALYRRNRNVGKNAQINEDKDLEAPAVDQTEEKHSTDHSENTPSIPDVPAGAPDEEAPLHEVESRPRRPEERGVEAPKKRRSKSSLVSEEGELTSSEKLEKKKRRSKSSLDSEGGEPTSSEKPKLQKRRSKSSLDSEDRENTSSEKPKMQKRRSKSSLDSEGGEVKAGDKIEKKNRRSKASSDSKDGELTSNEKLEKKKRRSKASLDSEGGEVKAGEKPEMQKRRSKASLDSEGGEVKASEKIEKLRAKKEKIKSWREERKKGSTRSLEDYLSDEALDL